MVAKITEPADFRKAVYYNEHKVKEGVAECIGAGHFLKETSQLTIPDKMQRFAQLIALNKGVGYNTLHISLNFDPSEKLSREQLLEIAAVYMEKIGFGEQPYLIYQHHDTHHEHVHIVTTNIRENGIPINIHNIARNQSEEARKAIEIEYNLVRAQDKKKTPLPEIKALDTQKLQYGKSETKRGITNVLDAVLKTYKYNSLPELNAILSLYNVRAGRGTADSRIYKTRGLLYHLLDENGNPVGIPIKASSIHFKPTLSFLEKKFKQHSTKSAGDIQRVKQSIDWVLHSRPKKLDDFIIQLRKEQIYVVTRRNKDRLVYGLTFVDTKNKSVLNGSDIGKEYTAKRILEKLGLGQDLKPLPFAPKTTRSKTNNDLPAPASGSQLPLPFPLDIKPMDSPSIPPDRDLIDVLLRPEQDDEQTPEELRRDKKKKRNQSPNN